MKLMIQSYAGSPSLNSAVIEYSINEKRVVVTRTLVQTWHKKKVGMGDVRSLNRSKTHFTNRLPNSNNIPNTINLTLSLPPPPPAVASLPVGRSMEANIERPKIRVIADQRPSPPPPPKPEDASNVGFIYDFSFSLSRVFFNCLVVI